ncbi:hypothetical protein MRX96_013210 [Rhipicephalus microplus]
MPCIQQLQEPGPVILWDHHPGTPKPCSRLSSAALWLQGCCTDSSPRDTAFTTWDRTESRLVTCDTADLEITSGYTCSSMST